MRKSWVLLCVSLMVLCTTGKANEIVGFWKSFHEKTEKAQCIFAVYEYENRYYGRIIGTYDSVTGEMVDTVYSPKKRAKGLVGDPFFSGLDIIWNLRYKDPKYKGKVIDPQSGSTYDVEARVKVQSSRSRQAAILRTECHLDARIRTRLPAWVYKTQRSGVCSFPSHRKITMLLHLMLSTALLIGQGDPFGITPQ